MSESSISHDLNNVLTVMIGWIQLARQVDADPKQRAHALEILELSAGRARRMVMECRDSDRLLATSSSRVVVGGIIEELLEFHALEFERRGIVAAADLEPDLACEGDALGLFRMIENLIENAAQAMAEGGHLLVKASSSGGERLLITVQDDGPGVDPEMAGSIFDEGITTRAPAGGLNDHGRGSGLGICRRIARELGGDVSHAPAPGGGARFIIDLPLARSGLDGPRRVQAPSRTSIPPGISVLVIDDEEDIREMIQIALTLRKARVVTVGDGEAGLDACRAESFDLALVDFSMPGLSGHELGLALSGIRPAMHLLYMSGSRIDAGGDSSVSDFIKKPFDLDEIQVKVREILSR